MVPVYRSDIDGLRAVAVLAVIAFHAYPKWAPGGFIGVDIFFVISGFLISGLIYKELEQKTFSLTEFYARRAKRIFPALVAVFIGCLAVGSLILLPDEFKALGKHVTTGAAFIANLALLQEVNYFDTAAELKPLLHLWSLGVEEQFYLVWPLLMLLCWRAKWSPLLVASCVLIGSFVWNLAIAASNPAAAFYLPVTRFWELMLGCILAFVMSASAARSPVLWRLRKKFDCLAEPVRVTIWNSAAAIGIALLGFSVLLIERQNTYPGWWALFPTLGTVLLISAGPKASINSRVLGNPALVYIGLISYPLYLWHWPILAFQRTVLIKEPTELIKLAGLVAAFGLAAATYRFVERPIRFGSPTAYKPIAAAIALALVGFVGFSISAGDAFELRIQNASASVADPQIEWRAAYRFGTCFLEESYAFSAECAPGAGSSGGEPGRSIFLWGDSHAAHLYPGLQQLKHQAPNLQVAQFTTSGCPPVLPFKSGMRPHCSAINDFVIREIELSKPKTVIMAANWFLYRYPGRWGEVTGEAIRTTVGRLKSLGVERVLAFGQFPVWQAATSKIRVRLTKTAAMAFFAPDGYAAELPTRSKAYLNNAAFDIDPKIQPEFEAAGAIFIAPTSTLCDEEGCLLVVPDTDGEFLAWDNAHLTKAGSIFFVDLNNAAILGR